MEENFLYKYRTFGKNTDKIIKNSSLFLSPIERFNDPFDSKLSFRQHYSEEEIRKYWRKHIKDNYDKASFHQLFNEAMSKYGKNEAFVKRQNFFIEQEIAKIGVLSLSKTCNSILMWSHYAHNHEGLVFGFQPRKLNFMGSCLSKAVKVNYELTYDVLSYTAKREVRETQYFKMLTTKYEDWKYEKEYRVIEIGFQGEEAFFKDELKSIIFGLKATKNDMDKIIQLCQENSFSHVKFKKAEAVHGKFQLAIKDL